MVMGDPIEPIPGTLGNIDGADGGKLTCTKVPNPTDEQVSGRGSSIASAVTRTRTQPHAPTRHSLRFERVFHAHPLNRHPVSALALKTISRRSRS